LCTIQVPSLFAASRTQRRCLLECVLVLHVSIGVFGCQQTERLGLFLDFLLLDIWVTLGSVSRKSSFQWTFATKICKVKTIDREFSIRTSPERNETKSRFLSSCTNVLNLDNTSIWFAKISKIISCHDARRQVKDRYPLFLDNSFSLVFRYLVDLIPSQCCL